jgi:anti-sigma regulatory factor (Ser/Thr protein kinase)
MPLKSGIAQNVWQGAHWVTPNTGPDTQWGVIMEVASLKLISSLELAALPSAISLARIHTAATLKEWQLPVGTVETAELLVSEMATNALPAKWRDGHKPKYSEFGNLRRFWLRLRSNRTSLLIEVRDTNPNPPEPRTAVGEDESGRGLLLVETLSRDWGFFFLGNFKIVWCEVGAFP